MTTDQPTIDKHICEPRARAAAKDKQAMDVLRGATGTAGVERAEDSQGDSLWCAQICGNSACEDDPADAVLAANAKSEHKGENP